MGPAGVQSLGRKRYILVVVDDFTRYTWVVLLRDKAEAPKKMIHLCEKLQVEKGIVIARLKVIIGENLRTQNRLPSAMIKAHMKSSLHPRHHNIME